MPYWMCDDCGLLHQYNKKRPNKWKCDHCEVSSYDWTKVQIIYADDWDKIKQITKDMKQSIQNIESIMEKQDEIIHKKDVELTRFILVSIGYPSQIADIMMEMISQPACLKTYASKDDPIAELTEIFLNEGPNKTKCFKCHNQLNHDNKKCQSQYK
eukprot:109847_1